VIPLAAAWVAAIALAVLAGTQLLRPAGTDLGGLAFGQGTTSAGARGVFAFSGQLSKSTYGVYVVDVDAMTVWVYEYQPQKGCLRLAAARSWRYDRYLENYNLCDMPPEAVEQIVEEQRQYKLQPPPPAEP